jgi:hypothetical protein
MLVEQSERTLLYEIVTRHTASTAPGQIQSMENHSIHKVTIPPPSAWNTTNHTKQALL